MRPENDGFRQIQLQTGIFRLLASPSRLFTTLSGGIQSGSRRAEGSGRGGLLKSTSGFYQLTKIIEFEGNNFHTHHLEQEWFESF
jgi:hypothetical protein